MNERRDDLPVARFLPKHKQTDNQLRDEGRSQQLARRHQSCARIPHTHTTCKQTSAATFHSPDAGTKSCPASQTFSLSLSVADMSCEPCLLTSADMDDRTRLSPNLNASGRIDEPSSPTTEKKKTESSTEREKSSKWYQSIKKFAVKDFIISNSLIVIFLC